MPIFIKASKGFATNCSLFVQITDFSFVIILFTFPASIPPSIYLESQWTREIQLVAIWWSPSKHGKYHIRTQNNMYVQMIYIFCTYTICISFGCPCPNIYVLYIICIQPYTYNVHLLYIQKLTILCTYHHMYVERSRSVGRKVQYNNTFLFEIGRTK